MNTQRAYNKRMEKQNLYGTPKQRRKKYKAIVAELGARNITLDNIAKGEKLPGFLEMQREQEITMDEAVILQQYAKAIVGSDTKAAEFLRDTVGEKPSTQIEVSDESSGLSKMSYEELIELRNLLKEQSKKEEND